MKRAAMPPSEFIGSFSFDVRLAPYDIKGSIAHTLMLKKKKIIPSPSADRIVRGLMSLLNDFNKGFQLPPEEDIHFAIEKELIRRIGKDGERLHTARSRNDQVITDVYLYAKDQFLHVIQEITRVQKAMVHLAEKHINVVMPGFTHLQHAQPILFSHHILAYAWMLERDKGRIQDTLKRADVLPLGSAALAGTSFPIDRAFLAKQLGFSRISENSIDATSSRDVLIEFLSDCAILMAHLSRLSEDLIIWSTPEFSFVRLPEEFTSGSSIMPQKRNPDTAEIIRGETGRVYGALVTLLTVVKGLPLAYNRDLQEDKPPLFDALDTVMGCLSVLAPLMESLEVQSEPMRRWCEAGYLTATELADYLAKKGVPFREAHGIVRKVILYCQKNRIPLNKLSLEDLKTFHPSFDEDALSQLDVNSSVRNKTSYGGTSPHNVKIQIKKLKKILN